MPHPALGPRILPRSQERQMGVRRVATEIVELGRESILGAAFQNMLSVSVPQWSCLQIVLRNPSHQCFNNYLIVAQILLQEDDRQDFHFMITSILDRPQKVHTVLGRVLQENRTDRIYIRGDLIQESAHVVTEAKKSHHLPSASWGARKVSSVIQSESEGLRMG